MQHGIAERLPANRVGAGDALALSAREPIALLDLEPDRLRRRRQGPRVLVGLVLEHLDPVVEHPLGALLRELIPDPIAHGLERLRLGLADVLEPNHVIAEARLDRTGHGAGLVELEQRLLERLGHVAAAHIAQIPALLRRARVVRVLLGEGIEIAALAHPLGQALGLLARLLLGLRAGVIGDLDQDVRGLALGRLAVLLRVRFVLGAQLLFGNLDLLTEILEAELDVAHPHAPRRLEALLMRLVIAADGLVAELDGLRDALACALDEGDATLLLPQPRRQSGLGVE